MRAIANPYSSGLSQKQGTIVNKAAGLPVRAAAPDRPIPIEGMIAGKTVHCTADPTRFARLKWMVPTAVLMRYRNGYRYYGM